MHVTAEQRAAWAANTADGPFNRWLNALVRDESGSLSLDKLYSVAREYGLEVQGRYAHLNPGQVRMNVGRALRRRVPAHVYEGHTQLEAPSPKADSKALAALVERIRTVAVDYRQLTGRPLGVTGEIGEIEAARLLKCQLSPARSPGFDAIDCQGRKLQIKTRCLTEDAKPGQRLGAIKADSDWHAALLVLLDAKLNPVGIWEADRAAVEAALDAPGSRARNERRALGVQKFKSIGRRVWPAEV